MPRFPVRVILTAALAFSHSVLAQTAEELCGKNHYILRQVCAPCPSDVSVDTPAVFLQQGSRTLVVGSERRIAGDPAQRGLKSLAIIRMDPSVTQPLGVPDPLWGDCGIARIPIWGAEDEARAVALQPDGKVLVLGTAPDPTEYFDRDWDYTLEPHHYLAVIRLKRDGTLDRTFATGGRLVFRVGEADHDTEYDINSKASMLLVLSDGRIHVGYSPEVPVATIRPDGTIEAVYASAPYQEAVARELHVAIEFVNHRGEIFLTSDPDEAVMLDLGGTWIRTGRAYAM